MTNVFTGWMWNIGLFDAVIHPIMVADVLLGSALLARPQHGYVVSGRGERDDERTGVELSTSC